MDRKEFADGAIAVGRRPPVLPGAGDRQSEQGAERFLASPTLVLAENHLAVRKGIELLLQREDFLIVGVAATAQRALEIIPVRTPDVALVNVRLADGTAIELTRRLRSLVSSVSVLIYSDPSDTVLLRQALASGARGIALKTGSADELVEAIRTVARGERYVDPNLERAIRGGVFAPPRRLLSRREREILTLLASGGSGQRIAEELFLSPETVRTHVRNSMRKLKAHTRTQAVALALQGGEIEWPPAREPPLGRSTPHAQVRERSPVAEPA